MVVKGATRDLLRKFAGGQPLGQRRSAGLTMQEYAMLLSNLRDPELSSIAALCEASLCQNVVASGGLLAGAHGAYREMVFNLGTTAPACSLLPTLARQVVEGVLLSGSCTPSVLVQLVNTAPVLGRYLIAALKLDGGISLNTKALLELLLLKSEAAYQSHVVQQRGRPVTSTQPDLLMHAAADTTTQLRSATLPDDANSPSTSEYHFANCECRAGYCAESTCMLFCV